MERIRRSHQDPPSDTPTQDGGAGRVSPRWSEGVARFLGRGSLTMECALVLPLFFFGMTAMISTMDLFRVETEHLMKLCETAKLGATYTYNPVGGSFEDIVLPDLYTFHVVSGILPIHGLTRANLVKVRTWNGKEHVEIHGSLTRDPVVYVTKSGTVYHTTISCRYLSVRITAISSSELSTRRNNRGQLYTPCLSCAQGLGPLPIVYVTEGGSRWHNNEQCSTLKRSVRLVRFSEVMLPPCSACG